MALAVSSGETYVNMEIGNYEEFPSVAPVVAAVEIADYEEFPSVAPVVAPVEIGDYQEFPSAAPVAAAVEKTPKSKIRHLNVVLLSFGLLCIVQGILNITLRLATPTAEDAHLQNLSSTSANAEPPATAATSSTSAPGGIREGSCSPGWIPFGNSCYIISSQRRNWDDSRWSCFQSGADLAIINSRREQAFLSRLTTAAWVGMTDRKEEGVWIWVDGTPVLMDRLQWARGQPDGSFGGEDCGTLYNLNDFIGLNDDRCMANFPWICEKALA